MLCNLCGRPEESHVCTVDVARIQAENAKLRAEVESLAKHAKEGWDLANKRTGQWKDTELKLQEARKAALLEAEEIVLEQKRIWFGQESEAGYAERDIVAAIREAARKVPVRGVSGDHESDKR